MCCEMFSSIPGLYLLDVSSTPLTPILTTKHGSRLCQCPHLRTTGSEQCLALINVNSFFFFNNKFIYYFWLRGVFVAAHGLSLVVASGGYSSSGAWASHCSGFSCCRARALGTRASVVVAHGLSCSAACGIFPYRGSNPCPLNWQADSFCFFNLFYLFIYLFIYGCVGSPFLREGLLQLQ